MDRETLLKLWDESWDQGIWIAPWSKAVSGLTAAQAAWRPAAGRHSIWQNVNHVCLWREHTVAKAMGGPGLPREILEERNFEQPEGHAATSEAWVMTVGRLKATHDGVRKLIADPAGALERPTYHLGHDCYHLGQIMQLRAMQGLPPIE